MVSVNEYEKVRLEFSKTGKAKFISHLDLNRTFKTAFTRAKVPIWYTNGFNPHPKMVFSLPLSLGTESVCEFLDIRVLPDVDLEKIKSSLNANLPDDIQIKRVYKPETKLEQMRWAKYAFTLTLCDMSQSTAEAIKNMLNGPIEITKRTKKTKSGFMQADISSGIRSSSVIYNGDNIIITAELSASVDEYVNPDYIIKALSKYLQIDFEKENEGYTVMKLATYFEDCETVFS